MKDTHFLYSIATLALGSILTLFASYATDTLPPNFALAKTGDTKTDSNRKEKSLLQRIFPRVGDIEGTVYESQTTGKPLVAAEVQLVEIGLSARTDASGNFLFTSIAPGTYTLSITHATYKTPTTRKIEVTAGGTTQVKIYLGPVVKLETVIVEGQRLPPTISRKEIQGGELIRIPGTGRDPLKGLMTLPSIGIPNDLFGTLYIRGSAPGDTVIYFDRTPLGYPFHFGGLFSTIHSDSIEDIHIYAGGYGAEFGLDSQAIIDIRSREYAEKRWAGAIDLNIVSPSGFIETRIGDKGYASVAGQFSTLDLVLGLFFPWTFPNWSDYQLKFAYKLTKKHHLMLNGLGAKDHFDFSSVESEETEETGGFSTYFKNGFEAQGIHLRSHLTDKLTSHLSLTRSHNFLNINFSRDSSQDDRRANEEFIYSVKVNVPVYTLREDVSYQLTPTLRFEPGFLLAFSPATSQAHTSSPMNIESISYDEEPSWAQEFDEFNYPFRRAEGYLQARYAPLSFLSVALGVRFDYLNLTEELSIQPRGSLSLTLPTTSTLRFAYGRYEQSPLAYQVLKDDGNRALTSSLTEHYVVEFEHELSPQTELELALYHKEMEKLVTRTVDLEAFFDASDAEVTTAYLNQGRGFVTGAEMFFRHRVSEKFFGWVSYAYTHAERRATPNDAYKPFLFNNTHIVSIVANYSLTTKSEIGAKWQYSSGTTAVPLSTLILTQDPGTMGMHPHISDVAAAIVPTEFPAYHRLDVRFSHKIRRFGLPLTEFIEVWNVYNRRNTIRFNFAEPFVAFAEELRATAPEDDTEEFSFDSAFEYSAFEYYLKHRRFYFVISIGLIYEF